MKRLLAFLRRAVLSTHLLRHPRPIITVDPQSAALRVLPDPYVAQLREAGLL